MSEFGDLLVVLQEPVRRELIEVLGEGPARSGVLAERVGMSTAAISRHLKVLRESEVVERLDVDGDGRGRAYRLRPNALVGMWDWLSDQYWAERLPRGEDRPEVAAMQQRIGQFLDAFAAGDVGFFETHLAEDATLIFPGVDVVLDKAAVVASVHGHPPYTTWSIEGPTSIVTFGSDASLLTTRVATATTERPCADEVFMTVVFTDRKGGPWQLRHLQQTPVDQQEA